LHIFASVASNANSVVFLANKQSEFDDRMGVSTRNTRSQQRLAIFSEPRQESRNFLQITIQQGILNTWAMRNTCDANTMNETKQNESKFLVAHRERAAAAVQMPLYFLNGRPASAGLKRAMMTRQNNSSYFDQCTLDNCKLVLSGFGRRGKLELPDELALRGPPCHGLQGLLEPLILLAALAAAYFRRESSLGPGRPVLTWPSCRRLAVAAGRSSDSCSFKIV